MPLSNSDGRLGKFPFTIRRLNPTTHLIRETDRFHEYPNIYVKTVFQTKGSTQPALIVLSDTGCGTNNADHLAETLQRSRVPPGSGDQPSWISSYFPRNLGSFLRTTFNPDGTLPYLVITTHCHYDHILGLSYLPSTISGKTTVLSSSHQKSFLVPRSNLAEHSLCDTIGVPPPKYQVGIWAQDFEDVIFQYPPRTGGSSESVDIGITIIHTPGHTPDSLTWYDSNERYISVGDSLYERESPDTRAANEPPMPTIFDVESNLLDWWDSLKKVIEFVRTRNEEKEEIEENPSLRSEIEDTLEDEWVVISPEKTARPKKRLRLGAAHVTADVDAENCLVEMQDFMRRVLLDEIPSCSLGIERGEETGLWDEALGDGNGDGRFSVKAPLRIIDEGRDAIPQHELARLSYRGEANETKGVERKIGCGIV